MHCTFTFVTDHNSRMSDFFSVLPDEVTQDDLEIPSIKFSRIQVGITVTH